MVRWQAMLVGCAFVMACSPQQKGSAQPLTEKTEPSPSTSPGSAVASLAERKTTATSAQLTASSNDASHATVVASLRRELVGHAKIDGIPITDVRLLSRCTTRFVTERGQISIDWSKVGNFAGQLDGATATLPIDDGNGPHSFTLPDGAGFRRVDGGMGLLADDCGGPV